MLRTWERSARDAGQRGFRAEFHPLPGRAALQFDLALCRTARADDELPGMAHQIRVIEFYACPVLAVVVKGVPAQRFVQFRAQRVACGVTRLQVQDGGTKRRDRIRPYDAGIVMTRLN